MKNLRILAAIIAVLLCLSSCGETKSDSTDSQWRIVTGFENICHGGELWADSSGRLCFTDFSSLATAIICPYPNCTHTSSDSCPSFGMDNHPIMTDDCIYFFKVEYGYGKNGKPAIDTTVSKANLDGTNRSIIATISGKAVEYQERIAVFGSTLYFCAKESIESGSNLYGEKAKHTLCSFDLTTDEFKELATLCEGYSGGTWLYGVYNDRIIISAGASPEAIEWTDMAALDNIKTTCYSYDLVAESLEENDLPQPISVQSGYYFYAENGETVLLTPNGKKKTLPGIDPESIFSVVNDKVFAFGKGYDLESGQSFEMKSKKAVAAYIDGKYILRGFDYDSQRNVYEAVDGKELVG